MTFKQLSFFLVLAISCYCKVSATSLGIGDLAITSFNSTSDDEFSFVLLTTISGTTTVYFTENGWDDDADGGGANPTWGNISEGTIIWSYTGFLGAGTEIQITSPKGSGSASIGTVTRQGTWSLSSYSDVIIAYTGTGIPVDGSEVTNFIWAFDEGPFGFVSNSISSSNSGVPTGLINGSTAIDFADAAKNNFQYDCSILAPIASLRTALATEASFTSSSSSNYTAPGCAYPISSTTTWNGSSWSNGIPGSSIDAILASGTPPGDFTAKNLTLDEGVDLNLNQGDTVTLSGNISGVAKDNLSGTLHNFALSGNSSNWISGAGSTFNGSGTPANGLNFDGSDDYVTVGDAAAFDFNSGLTVEAWINADALSNHASLVSKFSNSNREFSMLLLSSGIIEYSITFNGSTEQFFSGNTTLNTNTWYHVALTYDGSTMRAYLNGVADGTNSVSGTIHNGTSDLYLGARSEGSLTRYFDGTMDEVRIWSTARSQAQIQASMNSELTGSETGLVAYYNFNRGTADGSNVGVNSLVNNKVISYDPNVISGEGRLIFDNSGNTCSLSDVKLNIKGVVEVKGGTTLQTNDSLTLTASSATSYGQLIGDGTVLGNVTSQAWLDVSTARYHYLGSPFTDATLAEFNEGQNMVAANNNTGSVWQWNASTAAWEAPSALTNVAANGQGYSIYAGGGYLLGGSGTSELDGTVASGDINVALGYNNGQASGVSFAGGTSQGDTEGWNFLANPYPSQYDWNGQSLPSGMSNAFYVNKGGSFASYVGGVGTNGGTQYMAPFQGFWVQTSNSSPGNFTFEQDQRVTAPSTALMKRNVLNGVYLTLASANAEDELFIGFDAQASNGFDPALDAHKLLNKGDVPNLYTQLYGESYSICRVDPDGLSSFPLSLDNLKDQQSLSLHLNAAELMAYSTVSLEDRMLNVLFDLKAADYHFAHNNSHGPDRFILHFNNNQYVSVEEKEFSQWYAFTTENGLQLELGKLGNAAVEVFDMAGQKVFTDKGLSGSVQVPLGAGKGIYVIRVHSGSLTESRKVLR